MSYRIAARFEPAHKRLNGSRRGRRHRLASRGAWRVMNCVEMPNAGPLGSISTLNGKVWLPSHRPLHPGSLCDPFSVLKQWMFTRRNA